MHTEVDIRASSSDHGLVARRREHIAQCATRVFVENGYERTTVDEIADACAMSKGNLYNYVGSKEDILFLVIDRRLYKTTEFVEGFLSRFGNVSPTRALREFIRVYYQAVDELSDITLFLYQETKYLSGSGRRRIVKSAACDVAVCERLLRRGIEAGEFRVDNPTLEAHRIIVLGHMWALRRWFLRKTCTLQEYIREQTESVLKTILVDTSVPVGSREGTEARSSAGVEDSL